MNFEILCIPFFFFFVSIPCFLFGMIVFDWFVIVEGKLIVARNGRETRPFCSVFRERLR